MLGKLDGVLSSAFMRRSQLARRIHIGPRIEVGSAVQKIRIEHKMRFDFRSNNRRGERKRYPAKRVAGELILRFRWRDQHGFVVDQASHTKEAEFGKRIKAYDGTLFGPRQGARIAAKS